MWWRHVDGGHHFRDGDEDSLEDGFTLFHFRQHRFVDVEERRKRCWSIILEEKILIPAEEVKVYDDDGNSTGNMDYSNGIVTFVPLQVGATSNVKSTSSPANCFSEEHTPHLTNFTPVDGSQLPESCC